MKFIVWMQFIITNMIGKWTNWTKNFSFNHDHLEKKWRAISDSRFHSKCAAHKSCCTKRLLNLSNGFNDGQQLKPTHLLVCICCRERQNLPSMMSAAHTRGPPLQWITFSAAKNKNANRGIVSLYWSLRVCLCLTKKQVRRLRPAHVGAAIALSVWPAPVFWVLSGPDAKTCPGAALAAGLGASLHAAFVGGPVRK
jgi:hypothetical protein